jgi:HTH-like domain
MKAMARQRSHSIEFKRQVAQEFIAGESLYALSKRHDISRQLMGIGRSTFYDTPDARARDLTIVAEMKTICDEFEAYGYRRVDAELRHRGIVVNAKKIRRLMREHALNPKQRRRFIATTDSDHNYPIFPNLAKNMKLDGPNQLWVADITYVTIATCHTISASPLAMHRDAVHEPKNSANLHQIRQDAKKISRNRPTSGPTGCRWRVVGGAGGGAGGVGRGWGHLRDHPLQYLYGQQGYAPPMGSGHLWRPLAMHRDAVREPENSANLHQIRQDAKKISRNQPTSGPTGGAGGGRRGCGRRATYGGCPTNIELPKAGAALLLRRLRRYVLAEFRHHLLRQKPH